MTQHPEHSDPLYTIVSTQYNPNPLHESTADNDSLTSSPPGHYKRHETTSSITGAFPLFDTLDLATTTGAIDIVVTPQPGSGPAVLRLSTDTGAIRVALASSFYTRNVLGYHSDNSIQVDSIASSQDVKTHDENSAMLRSFNTSINSRTGPIQASLIMGNNGTTTVASETGAIALDIITVGIGLNDSPSVLRTTTQTGSQVIQINPLRRILADQARDITIVNLEAQHVVHGSGSVKLAYPDEWHGRLEAAIQGEGYIDVVGRHMEIDVRELKYVQAHHYQGANVAATILGNGAVVFSCGVDYEVAG